MSDDVTASLQTAPEKSAKSFREGLWEKQQASELSKFGKAPVQSEADLHARYSAKLSEYGDSVYPIAKDKVDYQDPNIGYKIHLNVPIESVKAVSEYLIREGYHHKYLSGGDIVDGKVFTIYTGSQKLTSRLAVKISQDIGGHLAPPVDTSEMPFAQNVHGRFKADIQDFTPYPVGGLRGIPLLRDLAGRAFLSPADTAKYLEENFQMSYDKLAQKYGEYFHG